MELDQIEPKESLNKTKEKKCPNCGSHFSFSHFLTHCGSDTLVAHHATLGVRLKEHRCSRCRKIYCVEFPLKVVQKEIEQYAFIPIGLGLTSFVVGFYFSGAGLMGAICLTALTLFAVWPMLMSWIKYDSAEIYPIESKLKTA